MRILVAYASKYGSTKGIAESVAQKLRRHEAQVDVKEVRTARNLGDYDAFVVGSAVYMAHWMKEATEFIIRNRDVLASRPVWLFSSGPLGTQTTDAQGRDLREVSLPKEADELKEAIKPRDHRVFFGALDPDKLGFSYKMMRKLPAARAIMPEGDFRDWNDIEVWANGVAGELAALQASSGTTSKTTGAERP